MPSKVTAKNSSTISFSFGGLYGFYPEQGEQDGKGKLIKP